MENLKKLLSWLKTYPIWVRSCILLLISALLVLMTLTACGVTRATVHNGATGTTTEIKITTNNPTSVDVAPNTSLQP